MDDVIGDLNETNDQIIQKMKDILSSDGLCFGDCKISEGQKEIQKKLENIEIRLEENEIVINGFRDIERKTEDDINQLKEKSDKIEAGIQKLNEILTRKKSRQNVTKGGKRANNRDDVAQTVTLVRKEKISDASSLKDPLKPNCGEVIPSQEVKMNTTTSQFKQSENKALGKLLEIDTTQNCQSAKTHKENQSEDNEQTRVLSGTKEPSEENIKAAATKNDTAETSSAERTLVLGMNERGENVHSEVHINGATGGNNQEGSEDKTSLQLVLPSKEIARQSSSTSDETSLESRSQFEVVQYEQERWINNHKCVHQSQRKHCFDLLAWDLKATAEKRNAIADGNFQVKAAQTLLLIDTSESMAENGAWEEASAFVHDYLNGLEEMASEHNIREERVTLVTFGRRTEVVQHLTFNMQEVRDAFDNLELGGPTPMFGGLILIDGAMNIDSFEVNGLAVYPKIILISDGNPTETDLIAGPDEIHPNNELGAKSRILGVAENISTLEIDVFCVPVGKKDNDFLSLFVEMSDGIMLNHTDGRNLARRLFLTIEASKEMNSGLPFMPFLRGFYWDPEHNMVCRRFESVVDRAEKEKIVLRIRRKGDQQVERIVKEIYRDTDDPELPRVGSRVRRGPDKNPTSSLDKDGPGTIVGHSSDEHCVNVNWDNTGRVEKCLYGKNGLYGVVLVEEPRVLAEEVTMAVGCVVVPGQDWVMDENFQGHNIKGISLAYNTENGLVMVKWENGKTSNHIFSPLRKEIVLMRDHQRTSTMRAIEPVPSSRGQRNKNIN